MAPMVSGIPKPRSDFSINATDMRRTKRIPYAQNTIKNIASAWRPLVRTYPASFTRHLMLNMSPTISNTTPTSRPTASGKSAAGWSVVCELLEIIKSEKQTMSRTDTTFLPSFALLGNVVSGSAGEVSDKTGAAATNGCVTGTSVFPQTGQNTESSGISRPQYRQNKCTPSHHACCAA